jgi:Icc protein
MKIAHLSDLHLNTFFRESNIKSIKYLLKYAEEQFFDHLVITGDLTDSANERDFEILRKMFKASGLLNSDRLSVVIGNHDIFGGIQIPEDIFNFPERCKQVDYNKKVKEFVDYFKETFDDCVYISKQNYFPYAKLLDDVLIIGLNSIAEYSRIKNPFASNGAIGFNQLNEMADLFRMFKDSCRTKILLVHHHFNKIKVTNQKSALGLWLNMEKQTMKLRKKKRLFNLFNIYEVDLVLHGHFHENIEYVRKGIKFFNAGASVKGYIPDELQINFIEINPSKIITETHKLIAGSSIVTHRNIHLVKQEPPLQEELKAAANY